MTTCSTAAGSAPARSRAAATARPPSSTAGSEARAPPNRPMGVLAPAQMTGWVRSNMAVPPSPGWLRVYRPGSAALARRQWLGDCPLARLKARLNASSES
jgi:hypothetical protein